MIKRFHNFRMRTQIFIFATIIAVLLMIILIFIFYLQASILNSLLYDSTNYILRKENHKFIDLSMIYLKNHIKQAEAYYLNQLDGVRLLFQQVDSTTDLEMEQLQNCFSNYNYDSFYMTFCYGQQNYEIDLTSRDYYQKFNQTIQLLNSFVLIYANNELYRYHRIFVLDASEANILAFYPPPAQWTNLNGQESLSFTNHMAQLQLHPTYQYFYTPPYTISLDNIYLYALTTSLLSKNNKLEGVIGLSISIEQSIQSNIPYNILLTNDDGEIVLNKLEWKLSHFSKYYIYDSDNIGFNQDDWQQIKMLSMNQSANSNCKTFQQQSICRYNSRIQANLQIIANKLIDSNFTLIMMTNITNDKQLNERTELLISKLVDLEFRSAYLQVGSSIIMIIITVIIVHIIFIPIQRIVLQIKNKKSYFSNESIKREIIKIFNQDRQSSNNILNQLELTLLVLQNAMAKSKYCKCTQCKDIEEFKFNKQQLDIRLSENNQFMLMLNVIPQVTRQDIVNDFIKLIIKSK